MVKIRNLFGDRYKGRQGGAVYQGRYGKQIRRTWNDRKKNRSPAQEEQKRRFRQAHAWIKGLTSEEIEGLKRFTAEHYPNLTWQQYAIKTALDRGKVSITTHEFSTLKEIWRGDWDAQGWPYREDITLTNNNSENLNDYQVRLELDETKVGPNFRWDLGGKDLRFYDENGQKIPYWVESWDEENKTAKVWVKVPLIPAGGSTTIKMYYGNEQAQSESDGEAVFEFFDDFDGTTVDTNKWNIGKGNANGRVEIVNDNGVSALLLDPANNVTNACAVYTKTAFLTNGFIVEELRKFTSQYYVDIGLCRDEPTNFASWHIAEGASDNEYYFQTQEPISGSGPSAFIGRQVNGSRETLASTNTKPATATGAYHLSRVIYTQDGKLIYEHIPSTGESGWHLEATDTTFLNDSKYLLLWQGEYENGNGGESYIDWVRVRKYAEQEPTASFGNEEYGKITTGVIQVRTTVTVSHSGLEAVEVYDDQGKLLTREDGLSNVAEGKITQMYAVRFTLSEPQPIGRVVYWSISGVRNEWTAGGT